LAAVEAAAKTQVLAAAAAAAITPNELQQLLRQLSQ
jgi:hypothetical protein